MSASNVMAYPARGAERGAVVGSFVFTADDAAGTTADLTGSNGRLVKSVARTAAGTYTITLKGTWARVCAMANLRDDSINYAKVSAVGSGFEPTVVVKTVIDDTGFSVADATDETVDVMLILAKGTRL